MNKKLMIITDSCSDIRDEEAVNLDVEVVPMQFSFGDELYQEGVTMTVTEFYDKLIKSKIMPKTSQPSPEMFEKLYLKAQELDQDVLVLTISSGLSGTQQAARLARDMVDNSERIHIVDTLSCLTGERLLVLNACRMRDSGLSASLIEEKLNEIKTRVRIFAVCDTLEYFYRGGRLSKAAMILGSLIKIKPFVDLDENGKIRNFGKALGLARGIKAACEFIPKNPIEEEYGLCYGFTLGEENLQQLIEKTLPIFNVKDYSVKQIGATSGCHIGPGGICYAYISKNKEIIR